MEIKSNNVLIGVFTLVTVVGMFLFLLWISGVQFNRQFAYYKIIFDGSVSGLSQSGPVQYNGLPVGKVTDLYLMARNPNKVVAIIQVDARTPVKEDSVAQLELSGLTGVAFIQLTGGSPESAELQARPGQDYPVIKAAPSSLQDLLKSGPETLQNANELIKELNKVVADNQRSISEALANLNTISKALADSSGDVTTALDQIAQASRHLNSISRSADGLMKEDVKAFIADAREAARSYREVANELDAILKQGGPGIASGLSQLPQLVAETRALVSSLDRFASRAQDDPARYFIGRDVPEVEAE
ncbi:Mammalian cell entry related domain protein [Parvibaculum lavamentivorans DS-1]|uniref:Mammalian cell entry related domain protein n=1 Tax=Parvibaculum lavamentivorans (strain DS-1 / DSM 13023 / NCIMB 13966) TaxID=402881 RepID=A7HW40_PARL1|nr:MlaD family protein [Parvibaculum lavamentivorans]ABS64123.1 Mammalian cell entry related domain protein [Parvibaculum lavamentivorans DS-1]